MSIIYDRDITSNPIRIGISGKMGSGKDTVSDIICEYLPLERLAFADRLKETVSTMCGIDLCKCYTTEGKMTKPLGFDHTVGQLLQLIGQSLKATLGNDIWIKCLVNSPKFSGNCIVTDVRFKDEAEVFKNDVLIRVNGDPLHIRMDNIDKRDLNHISETDLDDYQFKYVIENDGTLEDLRQKVYELISHILSDHCSVQLM